MKVKNSFKAFTLIELLIVMGIIAILLAISAYGIALVFRNSRNSQRAEFINDFKVGLEKYYSSYGVYPEMAKICINSSTGKLILKSPSSTNILEVYLNKNSTFYPSTQTSNKESRYCYKKQSGGLYSLQYEMERPNNTTDWSKQLGTSDVLCDDKPTSANSMLSISECT